jgi:glycosyltransferase involved in cell wall biosynthesis
MNQMILNMATDSSALSLITVVIPAHNAEQTLGKALNSVFSQSYNRLEIIVVNDGSTDRTCQILNSCSDPRLKVINTDRCGGASAARNKAIDVAAGDLIAFLDADDEWLPGKLEKQIALYRSGDYVLICSASNEIAPDGTDIGDTCGDVPVVTGYSAWKTLLGDTFVHTSTVLTSRSAMRRIEGFDAELKIGEDQDVWIKLALLGQVGYVYESLARIHVRTGSLSRTNSAQEFIYTLPMIRRHLARLGDRLSAREGHLIMARRMARLGRSMCGEGDYRRGSRLILSSLRHWYDPWPSLVCLFWASPPVRTFKGWMKGYLKRIA